MKSTKRTCLQALSLVLAVIMLLSMVSALNISAAEAQTADLAAEAPAAELKADTSLAEVADGTTEDGLEYSISDDEVTITNYRGSATELTIPSTIEGYPVTYICDYAFWECDSLTSITLPEGVTSIGVWAFHDCTSLASITLPESVTSIGGGAFWGCTSLKSITIPESVTGIDSYTFADCTSLSSITIPQGVTSIGNDAFSDCTSLSSITIPQGVTSIGGGVFWGCTSLVSITIPESVTGIDSYAFADCTSLESVTIPEGVTSIGEYAFRKCASLSSVIIPSSVTSIDDSAFEYCSNLESIAVDENNSTYDSRNGCNAIIETATNSLIMGCKNTIIPKSVTSIGESAFANCTSLLSITIPEDVTCIGDDAFEFCTSLESVTISEGVISIGHGAFYECESLSSITIPSSVTSIGNGAIRCCANLENIAVDENNSTYDSRDNCNAIIETATNSLIIGCKETTIPEGVTSIGYNAFWNCTSLESITIPKSVTSIDSDAFAYCESLKSIIISEGVTSIEEDAFRDCPNLESIVVDENNSTYDSRDNCNAIIETATNSLIIGCKETTIAEGVTGIKDYAFYGCTSLENITIPKSVTSIDSDAFTGCSSLMNIVVDEDNPVYDSRDNCNAIIETATNTLIRGCKNTVIPSGVTSIGYDAFLDCISLESITIPEGVTSIDHRAFEYCQSLKSIIIPKSVISIGRYVFDDCESLKDVYYGGSENQWDNISIDWGNEELEYATIHFTEDATEMPTEVPTEDPTEAPTQAPTEIPTEVPTTVPATDATEPEGFFPEEYISDEKTDVAVGGNVDNEVELKVSEVTSDKQIENLDLILTGEKVSKVFDITLQKDGTEVQPDGKVWVRIPAENPLSKVYRMETDGSLTDMNAVYTDGYLIFTTEHFSLYIVAVPGEESTDPTPPTETEPEVSYLIGDANGDGKINVKDATQIQKAVAGLVTLDDVGNLAADSDQNEKVNVKDATAIQKFVAGIPVDAPIGEERKK